MKTFGEILKHHELLVRDQIDQLSEGAVTTKVPVQGASLGVIKLALTAFFEYHVLLVIAVEINKYLRQSGSASPSCIPLSKPDGRAFLSDLSECSIHSFSPSTLEDEVWA